MPVKADNKENLWFHKHIKNLSFKSDIKNQLNEDLTVLLYENGYPPEWDEEVFNKVLEQAENFKKYQD